MTQARITRFLQWDAIRTLVFHDKMLCLWVKGFPLNDDDKEGYPIKKMLFCHYWFVCCENGCR